MVLGISLPKFIHSGFKILAVEWLYKNNHSIHKAALEFNISRKVVREWEKKYNELLRMNVGANSKMRWLNSEEHRYQSNWTSEYLNFLRKKEMKVDQWLTLVFKPRLCSLLMASISQQSEQAMGGCGRLSHIHDLKWLLLMLEGSIFLALCTAMMFLRDYIIQSA